MGWWTLDHKPDGMELFNGDRPLDIFGEALGDVAALYQRGCGRNPTREELEAMLGEVLGHTWPIMFRDPVKSAPDLQAGTLFAIPYGADGRHCCWGRVIAMNGDDCPWIVALDCDLPDGSIAETDLDQAARAPWLLGPGLVHPAPFEGGHRPIAGHRPVRSDEPMPVLCRYLRASDGTFSIPQYIDIDGQVLDEAAIAAGVRAHGAVKSSELLVRTLRAERGLERWLGTMSEWTE